MRCRIPFNFTLTLPLSLKGEGDFDYSLTPKGRILIISSPRRGED